VEHLKGRYDTQHDNTKHKRLICGTRHKRAEAYSRRVGSRVVTLNTSFDQNNVSLNKNVHKKFSNCPTWSFPDKPHCLGSGNTVKGSFKNMVKIIKLVHFKDKKKYFAFLNALA